MLVAVIPTPVSLFLFDLHWLSPIDSLVTSRKLDPIEHSWKCPTMLGELDVHLGSSFPTGETTGLGGTLGATLFYSGETQCGQNAADPLTLPVWYFLVSVA